MPEPALLDLVPAAIAALGLAAVTPKLVAVDVRDRRLPNPLVGLAALALAPAIAMRWALDGSLPVAALLAGVAAALAYLVLAVGGGMGMGDVKLAGVLAAGAALASPLAAIGGFMLAFLLGGIAAAVALLRRRPRAHDGEPASIPFGPWMLLGHWLALIAAALV